MIVPHYEWRKTMKNRFVLRSDFPIDLGRSFEDCVLRVRDYDLGSIEGRTLTVRSGFEWDGCTPSQLWGVPWLSVPSPAATAGPSLVHDVLCQFAGAADCPWDRDFADKEFARLLKVNGFVLRKLYVSAVRLYRELAPLAPPSPEIQLIRPHN